jgi:hypothetical protein
MSGHLSGDELVALVQRVFVPQPGEKGLAILADLPDADVPDNVDWKARREMALDWACKLNEKRETLGFETHLVLYPNVHTNNGDLPPQAWLHQALSMQQATDTFPGSSEALNPVKSMSFSEIYAEHPMLIALTEFSATAPLKMAAKTNPIRAATMPGFKADMIPALKLDYQEVNRRVELLKNLLDRATGADLRFSHPDGEDALHLDLRFRSAHASGGLIPKPGVAGNLPSGEAYIVPYEGEREGEPSRSAGILPVQFGSEVVRYRIEANKAVAVITKGIESEREAALLAKEPAYGNLAELGLGVLAAFGVKPVGEVLLDEKLGLHIAFGRSEHFGGQVAPKHFSRPEAVVHIDRVYVPETQPNITVISLDLVMEGGERMPLMKNGAYVLNFD